MDSLFRRLKEKRRALGLPDNMKVGSLFISCFRLFRLQTDVGSRFLSGDDSGSDGPGEDHAAEMSAVL